MTVLCAVAVPRAAPRIEAPAQPPDAQPPDAPMPPPVPPAPQPGGDRHAQVQACVARGVAALAGAGLPADTARRHALQACLANPDTVWRT